MNIIGNEQYTLELFSFRRRIDSDILKLQLKLL